MKTYRAVMLTKKGGPEVLQVVELPLQEPGPGELRVRVRATGVGATDLTMLDGSYPFAPPIPFVPGYEVAGVVDAVGAGVSGFSLGQRVGSPTSRIPERGPSSKTISASVTSRSGPFSRATN
jgi:NADPH:quinone reductase